MTGSAGSMIFMNDTNSEFASGKGAGVFMRGRGAQDGFFMFGPFRARNRRGHRLGWLLARQHPEWDLQRRQPAALELALLVAALAALELIALTCFA